MAITVTLPSLLARHAGGQRTHVATGGTVAKVLDQVAETYPELGRRLADATKPGNEFVTIYLNDEDTRFAGGLDTPTKDGDEVSVISAIAGG
jgi:molybdopterin converting factor small subunit